MPRLSPQCLNVPTACLCCLSCPVSPTPSVRKTWDNHQIRPTNPALPDNSSVISLSSSLTEKNTFQAGSQKKRAASLCPPSPLDEFLHGSATLKTKAASRLWEQAAIACSSPPRCKFAITHVHKWTSWNLPNNKGCAWASVWACLPLVVGHIWACSRVISHAPGVRATPTSPELQLDLGWLMKSRQLLSFLLDGTPVKAGAHKDFRCFNACRYDHAVLDCDVGTTSQVASPRKNKASGFLPGNGARLGVGHLSWRTPTKAVSEKRITLTYVSIWQPQNHGNHCVCVCATEIVSIFPPGKSLIFLELKVYLKCNMWQKPHKHVWDSMAKVEMTALYFWGHFAA